MKEDFETKFGDIGSIAKDEVDRILQKFAELKSLMDTDQFNSNIKTAQTASVKFLKSLIGAVDDLRDASEDAAEERLKLSIRINKKYINN